MNASFHFHGNLNDFLPAKRRDVEFVHSFAKRGSVKDMIEALGVPHPEIEAIVANAHTVDFAYQMDDGDQIEVYDAYTTLPTEARLPLRPPLPTDVRFILDQHLGQLATYLRMLGFDTLYRNDYHDEELSQVSSAEIRILLTRDLGLLKRGIVTYGYFVRETDPQRQVVELVRRYNLVEKFSPLQRCIRCNAELRPVSKEEIADRLEPQTLTFYAEFSLCPNCNQIYWKGSHYQHMRQFIADLLERS